MQLLFCCDKSLLHLFLSQHHLHHSYIQIQNIFSICDSISSSFFFHLQLIFVAHLANLVAFGNGIVFFCKISHALSLFYKDLLHIWQVFPIDNAVRQISRRKCKFFIKKELFKTVILFPVLIPILIFEHSDGN